MDVTKYNREAWNREVDKGNPWTQPVGPDVIAAARRGEWSVLLTPTVKVPHEWFLPMSGCRILCLASGGGQQAPIFAAAGAQVTTLDNSPRQLEQDQLVAQREGLTIRTVLGVMADLSAFDDGEFDLIFHPVSNVFAPEVRPVWREAARVLRMGGVLLAGFNNPMDYLFDFDLADKKGQMRVRYKLPYSDVGSLSKRKLAQRMREGWPLEYSHSLEDQIGGQCDSGFHITALFEDRYPPEAKDVISDHMPTFLATRAVKAG